MSAEKVSLRSALERVRDAPERAQLLDGIALIETADAVHIFGEITEKINRVAQRQIADYALHHLVDERGAIEP